jgi:hypothetical protein
MRQPPNGKLWARVGLSDAPHLSGASFGREATAHCRSTAKPPP